MEYTNFRELKLSKLMLGTVQFGLTYGIANQDGKPDYEKARDIIAVAFENGVNCFDTAAAYGNSEEVLGRAFSELGIKDKTTIVSKICHITDQQLSSSEADKIVEKSLRQSLARLKLEVLPICLLHREDNIVYFDSLLKMKDKGLVKYVGVSADTAAGAEKVINNPHTEAIQLPFNIFDKRYDKNNIFPRTAEKNMAVFSRSTYLQGLFFIAEDKLLDILTPIIPVRRKINSLAKENNMTIAELCMRYVLTKKEITCVLTGVDSVEQLQENLALFAKGKLNPELAETIEKIVPEFAETIVRPSLWPKTTKNK